jgi:hypothetical protein
MKILTFRRLVGIAAIGGFAYVHKQRGGEWTLESVMDTARHLWSRAMSTSTKVKDSLRDTAQHSVGASSSGGRSNMSEGTSSRAQSYYSSRDDDSNRH